MATPAEALDVPGALWRRRWLILVLTLVGALAALAASFTTSAVYTASTKVWIKPMALNPPGSVPLATTISLPTESELVRSTPVLEAAADQLAAGESQASLAGNVQVGIETDNQVLTIGVTAPTADGAQAGADAVAAAYLEFRANEAIAQTERAIAQAEEQLVGLRDQLETASATADAAPANGPASDQASNEVAQLNGQIAIWENAVSLLNISAVDPGSVVVAASLPAAPSSPDRTQDIVRGALAGLLVGLIIALALEARINARRRASP